jgi:hypothetical protein
MALKTYRSGVWHALASLKVFRSGSWRQLKTLKVWDGSAWRLIGNFVQPLAVSAPGAYGFSSSSPVTSNATTATPAGGVAPYSYSWAHISGASMTANSPASATTTFTGVVGPGADLSAVFRVTVTDSLAQTATADVTVDLTNTS